MIPFAQLRAQTLLPELELEKVTRRVLESGWFILGPELQAFEEALAAHFGAPTAGVGSGTEALNLALRALDVKGGVVTVPNTAVPTVCAILEAGCRPVFVDIDPETGLMDPKALAQLLENPPMEIGAVMPVHLFGRMCDMEQILELSAAHGCPVIEDVAQATGANIEGRFAGTLGSAGCFSFYPTKNLGACGDGGAVVSRDESTIERVMRMRNYGESQKNHITDRGINSRLDEMQAAILQAKLPHLHTWNQRRRNLGKRYHQALVGTELEMPSWPRDEASHVFHLFPILHPRRDDLCAKLKNLGVGTAMHYPLAAHLQPGFQHLGYAVGDFPVAESFCSRTLSLPLYPELEDAQQEQVIEAVLKALPDL